MAALGTYIHGLGLLYGFYGGPGPGNVGCDGFPGSSSWETHDAALWASWSIDYLMYDDCFQWNSQTDAQYQYQRMGRALQASGRNIPFLVSQAYPSFYNNWTWTQLVGGNLSWSALDPGNMTWTNMMATLDLQMTNGVAAYTQPGNYRIPDFMGIGNGTLTDTEGQTNISLWAILAAPLWIGCDLTQVSGPCTSANSLATFANTDVIAVDQDAAGIEGVRISQTACGSANCEVWARQLTGTNTCAIALLNRDSAAHNIAATFATIAATIPACGSGPYTTTRDLWAHSSLGTLTTSYTATAVPSHGTVMIKVAP
jgi:alpha-galactosidase